MRMTAAETAIKMAIAPDSSDSPVEPAAASPSTAAPPSLPPFCSMRLLNTATEEIREFPDGDAPPYAVLSHTWGDNEVTLADLSAAFYSGKEAYRQKIQGACARAAADGLDWIWIDTCCVDRDDLAELAHAVCSAFTWFRDAHVCYVYLADVPSTPGGEEEAIEEAEETEDPRMPDSAFRRSRWFARAWTLMELLAPADLRFYSSSWGLVGSRDEPSLASIVAHAAGVSRAPPLDAQLLQRPSASAAEILSWAARRETARPEDLAYCLTGLLGVSMPVEYGEGRQRAFFRLQQAVLDQTNDHTILAWGWRGNRPTGDDAEKDDEEDEKASEINLEDSAGGVLAASPSAFAGCSNISPSKTRHWGRQTAAEWTDEGLRIKLPLVIASSDPLYRSETSLYAVLACHADNDASHLIALPLRIDTFARTDCFYERSGDPVLVSRRALSYATVKTIHIRTGATPLGPPSPPPSAPPEDNDDDFFRGEEYFYLRADAGLAETVTGLRPAWKPWLRRWGQRQVLWMDGLERTRYLDSRAPRWRRTVLRFGCGHVDLDREATPTTPLPEGFILVLDYGGPVRWRLPYDGETQKGFGPGDIRVDATARCFVLPDGPGVWTSLWKDPWSVRGPEEEEGEHVAATTRRHRRRRPGTAIGDRVVRVDVGREKKCDKDVFAVDIWAERRSSRRRGHTNKQTSATDDALRALRPVALLFACLKLNEYRVSMVQGRPVSPADVGDCFLPAEGVILLILLAIGVVRVVLDARKRSLDPFKVERRYIAALAGEFYM